LKKDSDIEFGITTFYIDRHFKSGNAKENIKKRIENEFEINIKKEASKKNLKVKNLIEEIETTDTDHHASYAVAFMIYK